MICIVEKEKDDYWFHRKRLYGNRCKSLLLLLLVLSCLVWSCLVLSCLVLSCLVLFSPIFSCLVLSCLVLFSLIFFSLLFLSYLILPTLVLSIFFPFYYLLDNFFLIGLFLFIFVKLNPLDNTVGSYYFIYVCLCSIYVFTTFIPVIVFTILFYLLSLF